MIYDLPTSISVCGEDIEIRTDFRDILNILLAFEDPELEDSEKQYVCLYALYKDFSKITDKNVAEAYKAAIDFIDCGMRGEKTGVRTMDWEQDAPLIFPAINKVAGYEVRAAEYLHWWTFTGMFMEIRTTVYATVLSLRNKKAKGRKLEKHEKEFWQANKSICVIKDKLTQEEKDEKAELLALL